MSLIEPKASRSSALGLLRRKKTWFRQPSSTIFPRNMPIISNAKGGIEIEVFWSDQDVVEFQFRCSNGRFSGVAEIYLSHDDLPRMASALEGFPRSAFDSRELDLGTFNPAHADGGVRLHCYCKDSVSHAVIEVKLRGDACKSLGESESVALILPVEAAGIDTFLTQLGAIDTEQIGSSAFLPMAPL